MWLTLLSGITLLCSTQQSRQRNSVSPSIVTISAQDFVASRFPWGTNFTGTNPLPDKAGQSCGEDLAHPSMNSVHPCSYLINDSYLSQTIPGWVASKGAMATRPWTNGFSSPRLLGGLATHDPNTNTWTPDLDFEVVRRAPDGKTLLYNWTRIDSTLDGYVAAKTERFLIVLDNIPFAFVKPENRFYLSYGLGSAPDDPQEFAIFVGKFAEHLVGRYGLKTVSKWRFRLGTECDGPRIGPSWKNFTAPNPPFVMPGENGKNFTTRTNGLDVYVRTYLAVAKALKAVVPGAAFGPSNMAGISGGANGGGTGESCISCVCLNAFADRIREAGAPLDFVAASEYSKWDKHGFAPSSPMASTPAYMRLVARRAGHPDAPVEVHEWGWAGWGHWSKSFGKVSWPMGAFGGAWSLGSLLYQRRGGCSRVFHWGYYEDSTLNMGVRGRGGNASNTCMPGTTWCSLKAVRAGCRPTCRLRGYPLVTGHGWLFSALQEISSGPDVQLFEFASDISQHSSESNDTVGAVQAVDATGGLSFLVLHFSPDCTRRTTRRFRLEVSARDRRRLGSSDCTGFDVTQRALNRSTSVHDRIESELFQRHMKVDSEKRSVDIIGQMATSDGLAMLVADAGKWMELNRQSMRFTRFDGDIVDTGGGGCALEFELETPSMLLLRIRAQRRRRPGGGGGHEGVTMARVRFGRWRQHFGIPPFRNPAEEQSRFEIWRKHWRRDGEAGLSPYSHLTDSEYRDLFPLRDTLPRANGYKDFPFKPFSSAYVERALSTGIDWRQLGAVTRAKSQGPHGICGTFGQTQEAESQYFLGGGGANPNKKPHPLIQFSEQMLFSCSRAQGVGENFFFYNVGIESAADYPFNLSHWSDKSPPPCKIDKKNILPDSVFTNTTSVPRNAGEEQLAAMVYHNGPMQVGINSKVFKYLDKDHFITAERCSEFNQTGIDHSIGVVGFGNHSEKGPYWIMKNSWGDKWQDNGFFYIARGVACGNFFHSGAHVYTYGPPSYYYES